MAYPGGLNLLVTWHEAMPNFEQSDLIRGAGSPRRAHTMTAGMGMWVPCGGEGADKDATGFSGRKPFRGGDKGSIHKIRC